MRPGHRYESFNTSDGVEVTLRTLRKADLETALDFINDLVAERRTNREFGVMADTKATRKTEKEFLEKVTRGLKENNTASVAAFEGKKLIGNCEVHRDRFKDAKHHGYLGMAIRRGYRGKGIGERMMRYVLRTCKVIGLKSVQLEVFANNTPARNLYGKMGFRQVGMIPRKIRRRGLVTDSILIVAEL